MEELWTGREWNLSKDRGKKGERQGGTGVLQERLREGMLRGQKEKDTEKEKEWDAGT